VNGFDEILLMGSAQHKEKAIRIFCGFFIIRQKDASQFGDSSCIKAFEKNGRTIIGEGLRFAIASSLLI